MADTISDTEEEDLVDATKLAVDQVAAGKTPNEAIEKIARDKGYGAGRIRLISHAYNTGQQLSQWRGDGGILNKLASYALADAEHIIGRIYTAEKKAADVISPEYSLPPDWIPQQVRQEFEKAASALPVQVVPPPNPPDPMVALHKRYNAAQRTKLAAEELSRQASASADKVRTAVAGLVGYFRKAAYDRLPFETVEAAAHTYFGEGVPKLMDMVYDQARMKALHEKRATTATPLLKQALDLTAAPFSLIKFAMDEAANCNRLRQAQGQSEKTASDTKEAVTRPFVAAGAASSADSGPWSPAASALFEKAANGIMGAPAMGAALGTMLGRTVGTMPQPKDDMVEDAWMDLEDPEHQNELRRIRAHTMLNQLLTDPEEPIAAHGPEKVMRAYNEIAQASPRVAENIATLRPILRKRLEGHPETFETKEMVDLEKGIAGARNPTPQTSLLGKTPDKLLG